MNVYQTDKNGFLLGQTRADEDPLNPGTFLIPSGCVTAAPPLLAANETAKFAYGTWTVVPDLRGEVYWLADGSRHEITEAGISLPSGSLKVAPVLPSPPPTVVSMRQARLSLLNAGLLAAVNASVATMPGTAGDAARIEWEYAATVDRNSPLVSNLTAALSLTPAQLDSLFTSAATL